jgi:hypothetical protein
MSLLGSSLKGSGGGGDWLDKLLRAYALSQGQVGAAVSITNQMRTARDAARKAKQADAIRQQAYADLISQGVTPDQARLMVLNPEQVGSNMASRLGAYTLGPGDTRYNGGQAGPHQPTMEQQNFSQYDQMDPATRQRYLQYKDVTDPRFTNTPAGTQFVPRMQPGQAPAGLTPLTPEEIRQLGLPEGGPSQPATGGFPSPPRYRR